MPISQEKGEIMSPEDRDLGAVRDAVAMTMESTAKTKFESLSDELANLNLLGRREKMVSDFHLRGVTAALIENGVIQDEEGLRARFEQAVFQELHKLRALNATPERLEGMEMIFDAGGLLPQQLIQTLFKRVDCSMEGVNFEGLRRINMKDIAEADLGSLIGGSHIEQQKAITSLYYRGSSVEACGPSLRFFDRHLREDEGGQKPAERKSGLEDLLSNNQRDSEDISVNQGLLYYWAMIDKGLPKMIADLQGLFRLSTKPTNSAHTVKRQTFIEPAHASDFLAISRIKIDDLSQLTPEIYRSILFLASRYGAAKSLAEILHPIRADSMILQEHVPFIDQVVQFPRIVSSKGEMLGLSFYKGSGFKIGMVSPADQNSTASLAVY